MTGFFRILSRFLLLFIVLPIAIGSASACLKGWPESWRTADWSSSGLLPKASAVPEAQLLVLAARTGNWKSIFAEHMWLVVKGEGAVDWTRYDVVGWGNPVRRDAYAADAFWYGNRPRVVARFTGERAAAAIAAMERNIAAYPFGARGTYKVWPGPNSNSFVAWLVRNTDGLELELPPLAIGKDYLGSGIAVAQAPSRTGYTLSAWGVLGVTAALREGLELNILGASVGIDPEELAVKLPALGKLSLADAIQTPSTSTISAMPAPALFFLAAWYSSEL